MKATLARLTDVERSMVSHAFWEITGVEGYSGIVIVRYRDGGIMSTTPRMPDGVNRKAIAKALAPLVPQKGKGEMEFRLNKGHLNPE